MLLALIYLNQHTTQRLERMILLFLDMSELPFYVSARQKIMKADMPTGKHKVVYNQASRICNRAVHQHRTQEEDLQNITTLGISSNMFPLVCILRPTASF